MLKRLIVVLCLISPGAFARARASGYCDQGGQVAVTNAIPSTTKLQQSYPNCTLNILYTGGATGLAVSSGNTLTWSTGPLFNANSGWVGLQVTYNSQIYTIQAVNSPTSLTTTAVIGTNTTPQPWSMPITAPAAIFSNNSGTPLANPFNSNQTGYWFFYADNGNYDVKASGGGIPSPITWGSVAVIDPFVLQPGGFSTPTSQFFTDFPTSDQYPTLAAAITSMLPGGSLTIVGSYTLPAGITIPQTGIKIHCQPGALIQPSANSMTMLTFTGVNQTINGCTFTPNGKTGIVPVYVNGASYFEASDNWYIGDTYTTGTISVTRNSKTITGTGTNWTSALVSGFLLVNNVYTPISSVESATSATLFFAYSGPSAGGQPYSITYPLGAAMEGTVISTNQTGLDKKVSQTNIRILRNHCLYTGNCSVVWNSDEILVDGDTANQISGDVAYSNVDLQTFPNGASYSVQNVSGNNLGRMGVEWQGSGYRWADVSHWSFQMGTTAGYCISDAGAGQSYGGAAPFNGSPTLVNVSGTSVTLVSGNDFSFLSPGQTVIIGGNPGQGFGTGGDIASISSNSMLTLTAPMTTQTNVLLSYDQSVGAVIDDGSCYAPLFSPSAPTGNSFGVEAYGHDVTITHVKNYGLNNLTGVLFAGFNFKIAYNSFLGTGSSTVVFSNEGIATNNSSGLDPIHDNLITGNTFTDMQSGAIEVSGRGTIISENHDIRHPGYLATDSGQLYQSVVIGPSDGPVTIKDNDFVLGPSVNGFSLSSPGSFQWECFVNDNNLNGTITWSGNKCTNQNTTAFGSAITSNTGNFNGLTNKDNTYTNLASISLPGLSLQSMRYENNKSLIGNGSGSPPVDFTIDGVSFSQLPVGNGGATGSTVVCSNCQLDVSGFATSAPALLASGFGNASSGSMAFTVFAGYIGSIAIGDYVIGVGIPPQTYITGGSGLSWTLSQNTTAPLSTTPIFFYPNYFTPTPVTWNGSFYQGRPGTNDGVPTCAGGSGVTCAAIVATPATNTAGIFAITTTGVTAGGVIATVTWNPANSDAYYQCFAYIANSPATVLMTNNAGTGPGSAGATVYIPSGGVPLGSVTQAQLRYLCVHP